MQVGATVESLDLILIAAPVVQVAYLQRLMKARAVLPSAIACMAVFLWNFALLQLNEKV